MSRVLKNIVVKNGVKFWDLFFVETLDNFYFILNMTVTFLTDCRSTEKIEYEDSSNTN